MTGIKNCFLKFILKKFKKTIPKDNNSSIICLDLPTIKIDPNLPKPPLNLSDPNIIDDIENYELSEEVDIEYSR